MQADLTREVILSYTAFQAGADVAAMAPGLDLRPVSEDAVMFGVRLLRTFQVGERIEQHDLLIVLDQTARDQLYEAIREARGETPRVALATVADLAALRNGHAG